ncbi:MAG: LPS export ABC transporter ATP-binding protein [Oligoflexia bacterium]
MTPPTSPSQNLTQSLKASRLAKAYSGRPIVRDVSFEVQRGKVIGLLGPNGAGKTTSFYMVVGLVRPDSGKIHLGDRELTKMPVHERANCGVAYLPQEASVFRRMTVEDNISSVLEGRKLTEQEQKARLEQLIDDFRLNPIARQKAYTLSGGERRRVEVARALALDPVFLLLDEPFAGIDPIAVGEIQRMMEVLKKRGIGILITDHNVRETLAICDSAYLLGDGKILEHGTPQSLVESPVAREKYLGEDFRF